MTTDAFIDTNVLLYAVSNSAKEIEKKSMEPMCLWRGGMRWRIRQERGGGSKRN